MLLASAGAVHVRQNNNIWMEGVIDFVIIFGLLWRYFLFCMSVADIVS